MDQTGVFVYTSMDFHSAGAAPRSANTTSCLSWSGVFWILFTGILFELEAENKDSLMIVPCFMAIPDCLRWDLNVPKSSGRGHASQAIAGTSGSLSDQESDR